MDATASKPRPHDWLSLLGPAAESPRARSAAMVRLARLAAAEHMAQATQPTDPRIEPIDGDRR